MTNEPQAYFVWVRGLKGPERQKWADAPYRSDSYWSDHIIVMYPISQKCFDVFTLDELAKLYPVPRYA